MKADRFRFRAWDGEGMLAHKNGDFFVQFDGSLWENCCSFEDALVEKHDLIIMQSTGLLDVNGVEIFEGDVVEGWQPSKRRFVIQWCQMYASLCLGDDSAICDDQMLKSKVIGNIYENPELLDTAE